MKWFNSGAKGSVAGISMDILGKGKAEDIVVELIAVMWLSLEASSDKLRDFDSTTACTTRNNHTIGSNLTRRVYCMHGIICAT